MIKAMGFLHGYLFFICIPQILTKSIKNTINEAEEVKSLRKEFESLKSSVHNLTVQFEHVGSVPREQHGVMFFVKLSPATTLNKNSIVKFDTVVVDEGNNFNAGDGIFVAPVSGIYQFSWSQYVQSSKNIDTELRVDNVIVESMYSYIGTSSGMPATKVVLYKVKKGDHVWIQTSHHYTENLFSIPNESRSSFTGLLLQVV